MKTLHQSDDKSRWLKALGLPKKMNLPQSAFRLLLYEKGELLVNPEQPMENLLFVCAGEVHIYGLREDGSTFSVYLADQRIILGDLEFIRQTDLPFYTEATSDVICLSLFAARHRKELEQNPAFLTFLLESLAEKFQLIFLLGNPSQPVAEKLETYLREIEPDHEIKSIRALTQKLQCSRAQLQRAVRGLCEEKKLVKLGKGHYRLSL